MNKYQEALEIVKHYYVSNEAPKSIALLQELVDRATPKKVVDIQEEEDVGGHSGKCPNCHEWVSDFTGAGKHCDNCGQSLEWEEGEKK